MCEVASDKNAMEQELVSKLLALSTEMERAVLTRMEHEVRGAPRGEGPHSLRCLPQSSRARRVPSPPLLQASPLIAPLRQSQLCFLAFI